MLRRHLPFLAAGVLSLSLAPAAHPGSAGKLYSLVTNCSVRGGAVLPCTVEAINEGGATLYRHRMGQSIETVRITDQPSLMSLWDASSRSWQPLRNASVLFSSNTLCFNDKDLCVVNPNYLNSLLQDRPDLRGRDLVRARFASNGRVEILCYDSGCDLVSTAMEGR
ncbi:MAG: hypothetical protein VKK62_09035 [Synechococcaceae cyanobacterium]|nr:hypothetical protein [Synechococcaceae cyanobacterium]